MKFIFIQLISIFCVNLINASLNNADMSLNSKSKSEVSSGNKLKTSSEMKSKMIMRLKLQEYLEYKKMKKENEKGILDKIEYLTPNSSIKEDVNIINDSNSNETFIVKGSDYLNNVSFNLN